MRHVLLIIILLVHITIAQNLSKLDQNEAIGNKFINKSTREREGKITTVQMKTRLAKENNTIVDLYSKKRQGELDHSQSSISNDLDFNYYWLLLIGSSLSIFGLIMFKSLR